MNLRSNYSWSFIAPNLGKFEEFGVSLGKLIPSSFVPTCKAPPKHIILSESGGCDV